MAKLVGNRRLRHIQDIPDEHEQLQLALALLAIVTQIALDCHDARTVEDVRRFAHHIAFLEDEAYLLSQGFETGAIFEVWGVPIPQNERILHEDGEYTEA